MFTPRPRFTQPLDFNCFFLYLFFMAIVWVFAPDPDVDAVIDISAERPFLNGFYYFTDLYPGFRGRIFRKQ